MFEIDKPLSYYQVLGDTRAEFVQDGRQVHRGFEFTATGRLTDQLTLVGGFTLLDAQTKDNEQNPLQEGKTPTNVAEQLFKLYAEYELASVAGLSFNAGN